MGNTFARVLCGFFFHLHHEGYNVTSPPMGLQPTSKVSPSQIREPRRGGDPGMDHVAQDSKTAIDSWNVQRHFARARQHLVERIHENARFLHTQALNGQRSTSCRQMLRECQNICYVGLVHLPIPQRRQRLTTQATQPRVELNLP